MRTVITYGGTTSDAMGVVVERRPENVHALRQYQSYSVPGRNGILTIDSGTYGTYVQEYDVWVKADTISSLQDKAAAVASWLNGQAGFGRLDDALEPLVYRQALLNEQIEAENIFNLVGRFTLAFLCQPERWLVSGETAVTFSAPGSITNPTQFDAKPMITVNGTDGQSGTISIGGNVITLDSITDGMVLDCELMDAIAPDSSNLNGDVSGDFPIIPSGAQTVGFTGAITSIDITPRWWMI